MFSYQGCAGEGEMLWMGDIEVLLRLFTLAVQ